MGWRFNCVNGLQDLDNVLKYPRQFSPRRLVRLLIIVVIALAFNVTQYPSLFTTSAYSQVKKPNKRKNLFDLLFGKRGSLKSRAKKRKKAKRIKLKPSRNKEKRRAKTRRKTKAKTRVKKIAAKKPDAMKILVAGDFMGHGLAWGLAQSYADNRDVVIVDVSKGLSGFVRSDVKNWPVAISPHIDKVNPAVVVFLGGMNDRQQMSVNKRKINKMTAPWLAEYNKRTQALGKAVKDKKRALIWVGLPPVKSGKMSTDYLVFNEIFRTQSEAIGGTYVDVWDGFTNAEGQYVSAGPNINGQIKRLRASDGINMNNTGKMKLAFYVKRAIRKLTGIGAQTLEIALPGVEETRPVAPEYDPAKTGRTIVYSLAGPALDGGSTLEGIKLDGEQNIARKSVSYELVTTGNMPKTHKGRIDHYGVVANEALLIEAKDSILGKKVNAKPATKTQ